MSDLFQFFAQFKEMALADPWQFSLLVLSSGVVGWLLGKRYVSQQIATAEQHIAFLKDQLVDKVSPQDRELERKRLDAELKKQERLLDKQKRRIAPRQHKPEINDLANRLDWATHNLLNRNPPPATAAEVSQWEQEYRDWCAGISEKLGNRDLFTRADQLHFDTLGFVEPVIVSGNPQLDKLLSQLRLKMERLREVIRWAQQREP